MTRLALACYALVTHRTGRAVITRCAIVGGDTAFNRVALVIGTSIAIVARHRRAFADSFGAVVEASAWIAIATRSRLGSIAAVNRLMLAREIHTRICCTDVVVIAKAVTGALLVIDSAEALSCVAGVVNRQWVVIVTRSLVGHMFTTETSIARVSRARVVVVAIFDLTFAGSPDANVTNRTRITIRTAIVSSCIDIRQHIDTMIFQTKVLSACIFVIAVLIDFASLRIKRARALTCIANVVDSQRTTIVTFLHVGLLLTSFYRVANAGCADVAIITVLLAVTMALSAGAEVTSGTRVAIRALGALIFLHGYALSRRRNTELLRAGRILCRVARNDRTLVNDTFSIATQKCTVAFVAVFHRTTVGVAFALTGIATRFAFATDALVVSGARVTVVASDAVRDVLAAIFFMTAVISTGVVVVALLSGCTTKAHTIQTTVSNRARIAIIALGVGWQLRVLTLVANARSNGTRTTILALSNSAAVLHLGFRSGIGDTCIAQRDIGATVSCSKLIITGTSGIDQTTQHEAAHFDKTFHDILSLKIPLPRNRRHIYAPNRSMDMGKIIVF